MSEKRLKTWQKATALVPLALLSGAWTANLAATGAATAATKDGSSLPDGTSLPDQAIEAPASVSQPGSIAPGVPAGASDSIISSASANGIPAAALAAYQRAEQVINSADPGCKLSWELIAAIGRVESDHGRYGGNVLSADGTSKPGIYGIPLDGSNNTAKISDSDGGQFDNDQVFDRAIGPMQFIPSTWSVVGVDGDGDGKRNPQDIDDAALASAVYLCSGKEDLSTTEGQRTAIYRYNHSNEYVDLVLSLMRAYQSGDFSAVPNGVAAPTVFTPSGFDSVVMPATSGKPADTKSGGKKAGGTSGGSAGTGGTSGVGTTDGGDTGDSSPDLPDGGDDTESPTEPVEDAVKDTTEKATKPVEETLSALDKAKITCQNNFTAAEIDALGGLTACGQAVLNNGLGAVQNSVDNLLGGAGDATGGLLGN